MSLLRRQHLHLCADLVEHAHLPYGTLELDSWHGTVTIGWKNLFRLMTKGRTMSKAPLGRIHLSTVSNWDRRPTGAIRLILLSTTYSLPGCHCQLFSKLNWCAYETCAKQRQVTGRTTTVTLTTGSLSVALREDPSQGPMRSDLLRWSACDNK